MMPARLFVYGTLLPGDVRWHHLEPFVASIEADEVAGQLFDTGLGYPAAVFGGADRIFGMTVEVSDDLVEQALLHIDEVEAVVEGDYRRVQVSTGSGRLAWSYAFGGDASGLTRFESGSWAPLDAGDPATS